MDCLINITTWRLIHKLTLKRKETPKKLDLTHITGRDTRHEKAASRASQASR